MLLYDLYIPHVAHNICYHYWFTLIHLATSSLHPSPFPLTQLRCKSLYHSPQRNCHYQHHNMIPNMLPNIAPDSFFRTPQFQQVTNKTSSTLQNWGTSPSVMHVLNLPADKLKQANMFRENNVGVTYAWAINININIYIYIYTYVYFYLYIYI